MKNYAKILKERKKTIPHKKCLYVWQLQENIKHVTGKKLKLTP